MDAPKLIIVGGPNGSGKTTFAREHARRTGIQYVAADQIASELSPDEPSSARIDASRQFLIRVRESITKRNSLIVESTLAGRSLRNLIHLAKSDGYVITIVFVFLDSPDTCVERVKQRVLLGGHDVFEPDIRRRFGRSIINFWNIYRMLADNWLLIYNSGTSPENVAFGNTDHTITRNTYLFERFETILESND